MLPSIFQIQTSYIISINSIRKQSTTATSDRYFSVKISTAGEEVTQHHFFAVRRKIRLRSTPLRKEVEEKYLYVCILGVVIYRGTFFEKPL